MHTLPDTIVKPSVVKPSGVNLSTLKMIGNTPLIKIRNLSKRFKNVEIYAKAEWCNASGSVKARPALRMIEDGEKAGLLTKEKIILDATSGNTGIAYSLIGLIKGYKVELVMPENVCMSRKKKMAELYNAHIHFSDPMESSDGAIRMAREIYKKNPDIFFMPDQYNNSSNWKAHFDTTAKEIYTQTDGRVTHFIAGIGTSGTVMGTGRGLKAMNPNIQIFAVEPSEALHGIEGLKHMETSIIPGIYDESFLDGKIDVLTEEAYEMVKKVKDEEGIDIGQSSGAAMRGAIELAGRIEEGVIVTVFPDHCDECYITSGDFDMEFNKKV